MNALFVSFFSSLMFLALLALVAFLAAYAVRHRGRIGRWMANWDHEAQQHEKEDEIRGLQHEIENAQAKLSRMQPEKSNK